MQGLVFDIEKFAVRDGPGIRTTVFLKGCPLHCQWCHNPESQNFFPELLYSPEKCTACGECVAVCPEHCHEFRETTHVFLREKCIHCGKCAEKCCGGALENVGKLMSVDEVMDEVRKDKAFYDNSGGGLTLSGGEPLAQFEFAKALLQAAKKESIQTAVETSGICGNFDELLPVVDLWLFDLKASDPEKHRELTGQSNETILKNLRKLDAAGAGIILRCPLVPGINDDEPHLRTIAALSRELPHIRRIDVEPYHPLGENKNRGLGRTEAFSAPMTPEETVKKWIDFLRTLASVPVEKD